MSIFSGNQNLFFSLVGASATVFLGTLVFLHNRRSITNVIFIIHSSVAVVWAIVNYFSLVAGIDTALHWIRLVIFLAVPYVLLFFLFVQNFPNDKLAIKRVRFISILILMALMMFLALSPWVFSKVEFVGNLIVPVPGSLMPVFASILVFFFLLTSSAVLKKYIKATGLVKRQWLTIGIGMIIAYMLLIFFVFIRVIIFSDTRFVIFSPLFILPIFIGATYAILRHHLFNVKVIAAEIITFGLVAVSLIQIYFAESLLTKILGVWVLILLLFFGTLLIKSVLREVRQREELQVLNVKLNKANTELESLSRFKTQLLSLASHQVKSPLAAIKGFVTLVVDGTYGPVSEKIKEVMQKVKRSSDTLINLVNSLLDLRKVEEGKMEYQFSRVGLRDMVNGVVENLRPLAVEKKLELTFTGPKAEVFVNADGPKLQQVIQNLVDNAIKYTPNGFVKVELKEEPAPSTNSGQAGSVLFSVIDSGLGISKKLLPHLFEEFVRDERVKQEIRGTGLGLYIAKKIVEAHQGELWAESEGEGRGSKFFVKLKKV